MKTGPSLISYSRASNEGPGLSWLKTGVESVSERMAVITKPSQPLVSLPAVQALPLTFFWSGPGRPHLASSFPRAPPQKQFPPQAAAELSEEGRLAVSNVLGRGAPDPPRASCQGAVAIELSSCPRAQAEVRIEAPPFFRPDAEREAGDVGDANHFHPSRRPAGAAAAMDDREDLVYQAKLAEQAER